MYGLFKIAKTCGNERTTNRSFTIPYTGSAFHFVYNDFELLLNFFTFFSHSNLLISCYRMVSYDFFPEISHKIPKKFQNDQDIPRILMYMTLSTFFKFGMLVNLLSHRKTAPSKENLITCILLVAHVVILFLLACFLYENYKNCHFEISS